MIIHDVEQNSEEWLKLRSGIPTSSNAKLLITSKGEASKSLEGYAMSLAGEKYTGAPLDDFKGNKWTERGHELEDEALDFYSFKYGEEVQKVGFVTFDDLSVGSSPDAFSGSDGLVEIKNLKAENHIKAMLYVKKNAKIPPEYIAQVQDQMLVCGKAWCDSYFHHPSLPSFKFRSAPDANLQRALMVQKILVCERRDEIYQTIIEI